MPVNGTIANQALQLISIHQTSIFAWITLCSASFLGIIGILSDEKKSQTIKNVSFVILQIVMLFSSMLIAANSSEIYYIKKNYQIYIEESLITKNWNSIFQNIVDWIYNNFYIYLLIGFIAIIIITFLYYRSQKKK